MSMTFDVFLVNASAFVDKSDGAALTSLMGGGRACLLNDHRHLAEQIQLDHAFTEDVKVLELKAPDHAVVGRFHERGQDA